MFFAGYAKEQDAKRNDDDAPAEEVSHSALPQLSVSRGTRKDESVGTPSRYSYRVLLTHSVDALHQPAVVLNGVKDLAWAG